jgi:hypothetical protein
MVSRGAFAVVLFTCSVLAQPAADGVLDAGPSEPVTKARAGDSTIIPAPVTAEEKAVDWQAFTTQAAFFTAVQHGFRLATEPGTRAGLKGPFFSGYADAVGNLHGWGDGDPRYVNDVGHPMQGAVSGYLYIQNDPVARRMRFGQDRRYWRGRLRAMGAAWAYSTWFEIGPLSEASIGNIQSRRPQQGFVDHVVTPVIGAGWILAEDFLDEKVILPFERRFKNQYARMLMRGWLNPSRSMANMLSLKVPWYRDTRAGTMRGQDPGPRLLAPEPPREFPKEATIEISAMPVWSGFDGTQCAGGGGQAAFRLSHDWQLVAQLSGCQLRDLRPNRTGDLLTYAIGPRWVPQSDRKLSPYAQVLFGGRKTTIYEVDRTKERALRWKAVREGTEMPHADLYTKSDIAHGFALNAGTGVDLRLHPAFALRVASVEYAKSWAPALDGRTYGQGLQLSTGVILRAGTW